MQRSADRAQRRGGRAAAAAFLERATELTPDPARRVERALAAAQAKLDVADHAAASDLVAAAQHGPLDALQRARLERLRAQIAFTRRRGSDAPPLLLDAARRLEPLDAEAARETYLDAIASAMFAGRLSTGPGDRRGGPDRPLRTAGLGAPRPAPVGARHPVHRGLHDGVPSHSRARCTRSPSWTTAAGSGWRAASHRTCGTTSSGTCSPHAANASHATRARSAPCRSRPPTWPRCTCTPERSTRPPSLIDEVDAITEATGLAPVKYAALMLAAWRGDQAQALELLEPALQNATTRGEGSGVGTYGWAMALLHNAGGRHDEALAAAQRGCEHEDVIMFGWALVELIEAGVRVGRSRRGRRGVRAPERADARERDRVGARDRSGLARAAE